MAAKPVKRGFMHTVAVAADLVTSSAKSLGKLLLLSILSSVVAQSSSGQSNRDSKSVTFETPSITNAVRQNSDSSTRSQLFDIIEVTSVKVVVPEGILVNDPEVSNSNDDTSRTAPAGSYPIVVGGQREWQ